jgi:hypothetical protein
MRVANMFATPPPQQNPTTPTFPVHFGARLQPCHCGHEVLAGLVLVQLCEELARRVLVAGITIEWGQRVRSEREVLLQGDSPGDVLDVRIEPAVLMHHQDARQPSRALHRHRQVAAHPPRSPGRVVFHMARRQPPVILGNLLRLGETRVQRIQEHGGRHAPCGEAGRPLEEPSAIDQAVNVLIEEPQDLWMEIRRPLPLHALTSLW